MSPSTAPPPNTGPRVLPNINLSAIRDKIRSLESQIKYLQKNRFPIPVRMHEVANASQMQQAQSGHAPTYAPINGNPGQGFGPQPVLATLLFHQTGDLAVASSPPLHARYVSNIVGVSADLGTYGSGTVEFNVLVNGSALPSGPFNLTGASSGFIATPEHQPLAPYTDLVTVQVTSIGDGNTDLVVHVELSVDPGVPPPS